MGLSKLLSRVLEELECKTCTEFMDPPIYLCSMGHSVCYRCYGSIQECPSCRSAMLTTQCRNYTLESIYTQMEIPCKYTHYGCNTSILGDKLKDHEKSCVYGVHPCPLQQSTGCNWMGSVIRLEVHARNCHKPVGTELVDTTGFRVANTFTDIGFISVYEKVFKYTIKKDERVVRWCLQYVGVSEEAANYMLFLKFGDKGGNGEKFMAMSTCQPYSVQCFENDAIGITMMCEQLETLHDLKFEWQVIKRDRHKVALTYLLHN